MFDDVKLTARELKRPDEIAAIKQLIHDSPPYATVELRSVVADLKGFDGWWYGAHEVGTLNVRAVMCIRGHDADIYGDSEEAMETMATHMLKMQENVGGRAGSHRHELRGPKRNIDVFWQTFRRIDREVIEDRVRELMGSGEKVKSPSKRMVLNVATEADFKLVYEFMAEHVVASYGFDPRSRAKEPHARHCRQMIGDGRVLVGRDALKPMFVAEVQDIGDNRVLLDPAWVPPPFRARKRLISGAVWQAAHKVGPGVGKEVLFHADSPGLVEAAEKAGYQSRCSHRVIVLVG